MSSSVRYLLVLCGLFALLGLTIGLAYVDLGPFNLVAALLIAGLKALLVVLFFMELIHAPQAPRIAMGMGLFMLLILGALALTDYSARTRVVPWRVPALPSAAAAASRSSLAQLAGLDDSGQRPLK